MLVTVEPLYSRLAQLGFSEFEEEGVLMHELPVQFLSASPGLESEIVEAAPVTRPPSQMTAIL